MPGWILNATMSEGRSADKQDSYLPLSLICQLEANFNLNKPQYPIPTKYANLKGNSALVYQAICKVISEGQAQVDWGSLTKNDWESFAFIAENEGVGPLLYWEARYGKLEEEWPHEIWQFLQASYYKITAQNAVLLEELSRIQTAFTEADIPLIILKGAALAKTVYPDPGLRPMNDIDLMIVPKDLRTSLRVLNQLGYSLWKITYHAMLVGGPGKSITIELHWCLNTPGIDAHSPASLFAPPYDTNLKQPEAQFLYLCAHLFYQHFGENRRLIWGYDIYALIKTRKIVWNNVISMANRLGWQKTMIAVLLWVTQIFEDLSLPKNFNMGEPHTLRSTTTDIGSINRWMRQAFAILPTRQKLSWLRGMFFPSVDYLRWRYSPEPAWTWPVYLLRRWCEIARLNISITNNS